VKRSPVSLAVWALFLAVLGAVLWIVFLPGAPKWGYDVLLSVALPALAGLGTAAMALAAARRRPAPPVERLPDLSLSTPLVAVACGLLLIGTEVGAWLELIAAGLLCLALGGLVRELRAQRRGEGGE
jgi:amino acid transporter